MTLHISDIMLLNFFCARFQPDRSTFIYTFIYLCLTLADFVYTQIPCYNNLFHENFSIYLSARNLKIANKVIRCQFHQHFTSSFFVRKLHKQLFCTYIIGLYFFAREYWRKSRGRIFSHAGNKLGASLFPARNELSMLFPYTSFTAGNKLILKLTKNTASAHKMLVKLTLFF
jgi:hypothetical protein